MWHVSSRIGVATLRTAIQLLLTYLLVYLSAIHAKQNNIITYSDVTLNCRSLHFLAIYYRITPPVSQTGRHGAMKYEIYEIVIK